jgi:aspartate ammonia-lyase
LYYRYTANEVRCKELLDNSVGIVTALCPYIGYQNSADIAKESLKSGISVKELVLAKGILTSEELEQILDPNLMTQLNSSLTIESKEKINQAI